MHVSWPWYLLPAPLPLTRNWDESPVPWRLFRTSYSVSVQCPGTLLLGTCGYWYFWMGTSCARDVYCHLEAPPAKACWYARISLRYLRVALREPEPCNVPRRHAPGTWRWRSGKYMGRCNGYSRALGVPTAAPGRHGARADPTLPGSWTLPRTDTLQTPPLAAHTLHFVFRPKSLSHLGHCTHVLLHQGTSRLGRQVQ